MISRCLQGLASVALARGWTEAAAHLGGAAEAARDEIGGALAPDERAHVDRMARAVRVALGEDACARAWAAGRATSPDAAVAAYTPAWGRAAW